MEIPITIMSAIGHELLIAELNNHGIELYKLDIQDASEFLAEIEKTTASCAVLHIQLIGGGHKRYFESLRQRNPTIPVILIAPKEQINDRLAKILKEKHIEVVTDNSRRLPQMLVEKITALSSEKAASEEPTPLIQTEPEQEAKITAPVPAFSFSAGEEAVQPKAEVRKKPEPKQNFKLLQNPKPEKVNSCPDQPIGRKEIRIAKPLRTIIIAAFTGNRGAGGSWLCLQTAFFLSKFGNGCRIAVVGGNDVLFLRNRRHQEGELHYSIEGFDAYAHTQVTEVIREGYDFIVLDVGTLLEFEPDRTPIPLVAQDQVSELIRADLKICVSDCVGWKREGLGYLLNANVWKEVMAGGTIVLSCRTPKSAVHALEAKYNRKFYRMPACLPMELPDEVISFLREILAPILGAEGRDE